MVDIGNGEKVYFETNLKPNYLDIPYVDTNYYVAKKVSFMVIPMDEDEAVGICIKSDMEKFEVLKRLIWKRIEQSKGEF